MKKQLKSCNIIVFIVCCLFTMGSCNINTDVNTKENPSNIEKEQNESVIYAEQYTDMAISIKYPQIGNIEDATKCSTVNRLIETEALRILDYYDPADFDKLTMEIDFEVQTLTDDFISIIYKGWGEVDKTAHPLYWFISTNIDIQHECKVKLIDNNKIDMAFIDAFRLAAVEQYPERGLTISRETNEKLLEYLKLSDSLELGAENQRDVYSYYQGTKLHILFPVPYAVGNFIDITMGM